MDQRANLLLSVCVWLLYLVLLSSGTPCAYVNFPSLDDYLVTIQEHTALNLTFNVNYDNCDTDAPFSLQVTKITSVRGEVKCSLLHRNGKCETPVRQSKCSCTSERGTYLLTHDISRSDNLPTVWVWSTSTTILKEKNITFNVIYPPNITSLSVAERLSESTWSTEKKSSTVYLKENSFVTVFCAYDGGNPPNRARLLDKNRVEMEGSIYSSGQIRYRFPAVNCQDSGLISCEAPGASHNESATVLVKCSPDIRPTGPFHIVSGTTYVELNVRAHTRKFDECKLWRLSADLVCSVTAAKGTPPDLVLTVRLDNVKKQDEGQWTLTLTNDVGPGHLSISLLVEEAQQQEVNASNVLSFTANPTPTEADSSASAGSGDGPKDSTLTYIVTVIAIVLVIGILSFSVSITIIYVKKAARTNGLQAVRRDEPEVIQLPVIAEEEERSSTGSGSVSHQSNNTYQEVQDGSAEIEPCRPAVRHCQAPRVDPEHADYLHPLPTPSDLRTVEASGDTNSSQDSQAAYQNCSSSSK